MFINGMYVLDEDEVSYLREVTSILDPFQQVTKWVSGEKYPTMSRSIVLFNTLLDHLEKKIITSHVFPPGEGYGRVNTSVVTEVLQHKIDILQRRYTGQLTSSGFNDQSLIFKGCWLGRLKLLKYYMKTDSSKVYPIATFCDSSIKNRFWTAGNWGEYGVLAMRHVEDEWIAHYKPFVQEDIVDTFQYASSNNIFAQIALDLHEGIEAERDDNDDELQLYKRERPSKFEVSTGLGASRQFTPTVHDSETDSLLPEDDVYIEFAPNNAGSSSTGNEVLSESFTSDDQSSSGSLHFWKQNQHRFPSLSKMAKKYLSVPSTSTACERCFSRSGRLVTSSRSRLTPENVKKIMLVSYWIDMIDEDGLAEAQSNST